MNKNYSLRRWLTSVWGCSDSTTNQIYGRNPETHLEKGILSGKKSINGKLGDNTKAKVNWNFEARLRVSVPQLASDSRKLQVLCVDICQCLPLGVLRD